MLVVFGHESREGRDGTFIVRVDADIYSVFPIAFEIHGGGDVGVDDNIETPQDWITGRKTLDFQMEKRRKRAARRGVEPKRNKSCARLDFEE